MAKVFIGVGSNINREQNIRSAIALLRVRFGELLLSPVYESEAVGFEGENFYNLVVALESDLEPQQLTRVLHEIETECGRERNSRRFAPRILDLDLLLYDDYVSDREDLHVPREDIITYAFVLRPLADIAGDLHHPVTGVSYRELWQAFDSSVQSLWPANLDLD